jgi:hypothetical protein
VKAIMLVALFITGVAAQCAQTRSPIAQAGTSVQNDEGLRLVVAEEDPNPALAIVLPGRAASDRAIKVLFPEHVTAQHGNQVFDHLYLFEPGPRGHRPLWRRVGGFRRAISPRSPGPFRRSASNIATMGSPTTRNRAPSTCLSSPHSRAITPGWLRASLVMRVTCGAIQS